MNKTAIEWCDMTWNPVTGCLHGCEYCYARGIAHRFGGNFTMSRCSEHGFLELYGKPDNPYPDKFDPTFHRYRLGEPAKVKKPQNIFVCSMADLFGDWVPDEWIRQVFAACEAAPWHKYMFLTKNPLRYSALGYSGILPHETPKNMWLGSTVTNGITNYFVSRSQRRNTFLSIEPLHTPFDKWIPIGLGWVIVGAETGNRKGKVTPKREWIESIVEQCRAAGVPVFMKNSLAPIWGEPLIQEWPEGLTCAP